MNLYNICPRCNRYANVEITERSYKLICQGCGLGSEKNG